MEHLTYWDIMSIAPYLPIFVNSMNGQNLWELAKCLVNEKTRPQILQNFDQKCIIL